MKVFLIAVFLASQPGVAQYAVNAKGELIGFRSLESCLHYRADVALPDAVKRYGADLKLLVCKEETR